MNDERLDREIRERFEELKAGERGRAPAFADMYARAQTIARAETGPATRPIRRWPFAVATLAAAALAGLLLLGPDSADAEFEALVTAFAEDAPGWRSPTDGLLDVPGIELVNSIPTIGGPYATPLDDAGARPRSDDVTG